MDIIARTHAHGHTMHMGGEGAGGGDAGVERRCAIPPASSTHTMAARGQPPCGHKCTAMTIGHARRRPHLYVSLRCLRLPDGLSEHAAVGIVRLVLQICNAKFTVSTSSVDCMLCRRCRGTQRWRTIPALVRGATGRRQRRLITSTRWRTISSALAWPRS